MGETDIKTESNQKENSENTENKYEFVTETIKRKPVDKKRLGHKVLFTVLLAIVFGIVASLVFVFLTPKIYSKIYPEEISTISIKEEEMVDNAKSEELDNVEDADESLDIIKLNENSESDNTETSSDGNGEETSSDENGEAGNSEDNKQNDEVSDEEKAEGDLESANAEGEDNKEEVKEPEIRNTIINQVTEIKELALDDYKSLYKQMYEVAGVASRYVVTVTGISESTDWFMNSYENGNQSTGIILADNGKELIIITNLSSLNDAKDIEVTFCNGEIAKGIVKKSDKETGLVVVAVNLDDLSDGAKNAISMARLGNSSLKTLTGTPIIAMGAPLGINDSIAFGLVTSNMHAIDVVDSTIRYITTDIYGGTTGSGILVDLDGRVLGIIFQGGINNDTKNLIHAYGISDIRGMLEKLSNGQDLAYFGVNGTDVTKQINEELGVPFGAYVTQVKVDSPAMKAGIQNGDIIVKLGTTDINSFNDFKEAMLKCQPGDLTVVTVKRLGKDEYVELSYEISLEAVK